MDKATINIRDHSNDWLEEVNECIVFIEEAQPTLSQYVSFLEAH